MALLAIHRGCGDAGLAHPLHSVESLNEDVLANIQAHAGHLRQIVLISYSGVRVPLCGRSRYRDYAVRTRCISMLDRRGGTAGTTGWRSLPSVFPRLIL